MARKLRTELETEFGPEYAGLIAVAEEVRAELKEQEIRVSPDTWQQALELDDLLAIIRSGQKDQAKKKLYQNLLEAAD